MQTLLEIKQRLKDYMARNGLTQGKIAPDLGITAHTLGKFLRFDIQPLYSTVENIVRFLDRKELEEKEALSEQDIKDIWPE